MPKDYARRCKNSIRKPGQFLTRLARHSDLDSLRTAATYFRPSWRLFAGIGIVDGEQPVEFEERINGMFRAAVSQVTTSRWDLAEEIPRLAGHGFEALAIWRHKLSDIGLQPAQRMLRRAGIRVSSVQWAGGFTGGDGRTFEESIADALEAIESAAVLAAPAVVLHSGCRGGHTRSHAHRLLVQALEALAPAATSAGVALALKPLHPAAAPGCSFLTRLVDAVEIIDNVVGRGSANGCVGLALDLWHFADDPDLADLLPLLAERTVVVQVADRNGSPTAEQERLPAGRGTLPLAEVVAGLVSLGYDGDFEFDPVGEAVEAIGYDRVLDELRLVAVSWSTMFVAAGSAGAPVRQGQAWQPRYRARAGAGARRSHASSQIVSRG